MPQRDLRHEDEFLDERPRPAHTWGPGGEGAGDTWASLLPNGNVLVQTNPPGISNNKLKRANDRYASIRGINGKAKGRLAPEAAAAAAPSFAPEAATACPETSIWRLYEFNGTSLIPSRRGLCVTINPACWCCRPAK